MEDDWARQPWTRESRVGAIPRRLRPVLHAQAGGPQTPQGGMVRQPGEEGSALCAGRSGGRFNGVGERRRATQAPAGGVEDDRTRAEVEIRSGLAALPRRLRSLLR